MSNGTEVIANEQIKHKNHSMPIMNRWKKYRNKAASLLTKRDIIGIALVGSVLVASLLFSDSHALTILTETSNSPWFLLLILTVYLFRPFFGWPHGVFPTTVGFIYGFQTGVIIGLLGGIITVVPLYFIGKYFKTDDGLLGRAGLVSDRFFSTTGETRGVIGARLTPLPTDVVAYAAGIAGVRVHTYLFGMFVGGLPWVIGFVYLGATAQRLSIGTVQIPGSTILILAIFGIILVIAHPVYQKIKQVGHTLF